MENVRSTAMSEDGNNLELGRIADKIKSNGRLLTDVTLIGTYDTKRDSLPLKTVHTTPNGISYSTRRCIRHQTGFFTAQDGAYDTKRDFLPLKTVHTTPNGISYGTGRCIRHQTRFFTAQDGAYDTKPDFLHCFHSNHCSQLKTFPIAQDGSLSVHFIIKPL
ncbi:hypothetical protein DPV78_003416 [Talaromyces pinophilus]|nr:hypothetical protein DPV78_003416 [Talaromyces pinophilus]